MCHGYSQNPLLHSHPCVSHCTSIHVDRTALNRQLTVSIHYSTGSWVGHVTALVLAVECDLSYGTDFFSVTVIVTVNKSISVTVKVMNL